MSLSLLLSVTRSIGLCAEIFLSFEEGLLGVVMSVCLSVGPWKILTNF